MELMLLFGAVLVAAIIYLNYMSTQIIHSSRIHSPEKKQNLVMTVWLLPVIGVFIAMLKIKKNREKVEGEIAPAIRELADKLKNLEIDIQREKQKEQQRQEGNNESRH
jgi:ABC-type thiamin/hydroxymethylpyrimidine transport system permease subunit